MVETAGLYIHVPFCRTRCPFCSFAITTDLARTGAWVEALEREMDLRAGAWALPFDTVYLGGGTPSLLDPGVVRRLLDGLRRRFAIAPGAEVTLEANPGTLGAGDFGRLLDAGVNRLSLGVQSFDDRDLEFLGRDHAVRDSLESFEMARSGGFRNLSIDLIYGLPGRTREHWGAQLRRARALGPDHLSAYQLTYEPGTPLARRKERGEFAELSEDEARDLFLLTRSALEEAGFRQYEVSSFARAPAFESRHNRKYWEGAAYLGLGPAAHSFRGGVRSWNTPGARAYTEALEAGRDPEAGREALTREERRLERIFLSLRTRRGLALDSFAEEFGEELQKSRAGIIALFLDGGLGEVDGGVLRLTPAGLAVADGLASRLAGAP